MHALHRIGAVHGNLAARNVMLNTSLQAVICDFSLHREKENVEPSKWLPPEVALSTEFSLTQKSDIWAFAVTLWEIFTFGAMPYQSSKHFYFMKV